MLFALKTGIRPPHMHRGNRTPLNQALIMPSVRADGQSGKVKKLRIKAVVL